MFRYEGVIGPGPETGDYHKGMSADLRYRIRIGIRTGEPPGVGRSTRTRTPRRRRGVRWAFAHGVHRIGNGIVVVGDGVTGVCTSAGANDKDGGVNDGEGDADGGVGVVDGGVGVKAGGGVNAGGGASAGCTKIGAGDVTRMTSLLLLGVESSIWWSWEGALGAGVGGGAGCSVHVGMLGGKMLIVAWHGYSWGMGKSAGLRIPTRTRTPVVPVPVTRAGYPYPCRSLDPDVWICKGTGFQIKDMDRGSGGPDEAWEHCWM
ncbi:uncharacterized protein F5147DRAFT_658806 [Suillus discolor]|uniref:Uncharacterized protein n=1 Tax=Suillus discolor TaxID=1912936 RepID=A0A9P7JM46_9AGAM|nr:uncharacterized protein F5147DRAFT_658806 [Suillus discolor]KAG2087997.1 hypothetical protein F5147DRAFT_658806 [Suillus discolor]